MSTPELSGEGSGEPRYYVVGLPVCVTVHEDGRVDFTVDLAEVEDIDENLCEAYSDLQVIKDTATVSDAAARVGNALTNIIHPVFTTTAQEAS